jgi:hypothetical protein
MNISRAVDYRNIATEVLEKPKEVNPERHYGPRETQFLL